MNSEQPIVRRYDTLDDIEMRMEELRIKQSEGSKRALNLRKQIFTPQKGKSSSKTNWSSLLSNSVGFIDGALLAWKIYRRFKK